MSKGALIALSLLVCTAAFGQLDSNSITVTASNNVNVQPDQAVFAVTVQSGLTTGLEDVLAALQGSNITAANLAGVSTQSQFIAGNPAAPILSWVFALTAPLTNTKATVASLTTLQQNIAKANNGLMLSFTIAGTQVSAQAQTCSLSNLVASATTQAQNLAAAGGVTLGPIVALSGSTGNVIASPQFIASGPYVSSIVNSVSPPCAITVKFTVIRFQ